MEQDVLNWIIPFGFLFNWLRLGVIVSPSCVYVNWTWDTALLWDWGWDAIFGAAGVGIPFYELEVTMIAVYEMGMR